MDLLTPPTSVGPACRPNISATGRRDRIRVGVVAVIATVAAFAAVIALHAAWWTRLLVGLPAAGAAICFLQVARNTCVARAAEGTFEHDDRSRTPAPADDVAASRRVARTIVRDAAGIGVAVAALAAATSALA